MNFRQPYPGSLPDPGTLGYPQAVEMYLFRLRAFYNSRASWHRRLYRFSGVTVILAGAAIPLVVSLSYVYKDLIVSLIGVAIAALTALRAFYRWDQSWVLLRSTERTITGAWWDYHAKISTLPDGDGGLADRHAAACALAQLLVQVRQDEQELFFKDMKFPTGKDTV
jgi:hypothetical protein